MDSSNQELAASRVSPLVPSPTVHITTAASAACECINKAACFSLTKAKYVVYSSKNEGGAVRTWRTEKAVNGCCYSLYIGTCKKKAHDASAQSNNPEQDPVTLLKNAVRVVKLPYKK